MDAVIFDLDGTLADASHRLHWVTGGKRDWDAFFADMHKDKLFEPIRRLLWRLEKDNEIVLCSGRPDNWRETTEIWLRQNSIHWSALYMRTTGDTRADHIVKAELLDRMREDNYEPWLAVDDRPSIVAMWREKGITCLQCRDWDEAAPVASGILTLMVGPSGAGKTTWLGSEEAEAFGIHPSHVVSSDQIRADLCGDFRDQSRNEDVFAALHAVVRSRVTRGLPTVVDATNLRRKDRMTVAALSPDGKVRYVIIDRPMEGKRRDAGWRAELIATDGQPFDLLEKHQQTFNSQIKDILKGDALPNVEVIDLRRAT